MLLLFVETSDVEQIHGRLQLSLSLRVAAERLDSSGNSGQHESHSSCIRIKCREKKKKQKNTHIVIHSSREM